MLFSSEAIITSPVINHSLVNINPPSSEAIVDNRRELRLPEVYRMELFVKTLNFVWGIFHFSNKKNNSGLILV